MPRRREPRPFHTNLVRWQLPDGTRCVPGTPGAKCVRGKTATYYARVAGKRVALGTDNYTTACAILREKQREAESLAAGITTPALEQAKRTLEEHVNEWGESVTAKGTATSHVKQLKKKAMRLAAIANWKRLGDITADSCRKALARLGKPMLPDERRGHIDKEEYGLSMQTRNHYLSAIKQFLHWAVETDRWHKNQLAPLRPGNVREDRRHDRRAPTDEEMAKFFAHLETDEAPVRRWMNSRQRALGYRLCMTTGLRASELRSLSRKSFDLEGGTVAVRASYDKRGRPVVQHLPDWLTAELKEWFDAGGSCWETLRPRWPGEMLIADLEAAGVPYSVPGPDGPLFWDFHAFRHWYVTAVANQPGLSLKTLLQLTRHSTPQLALQTYAKVRNEDVRNAAAKIPRIGVASVEKPDCG